MTISMDPIIKLDALTTASTDSYGIGRYTIDIGIVERNGEGAMSNLTDNYVFISRF